jgi:hypothetical protein
MVKVKISRDRALLDAPNRLMSSFCRSNIRRKGRDPYWRGTCGRRDLPTFQFCIQDDRHVLPTVVLRDEPTETRAAARAREMLQESPHHLAVEYSVDEPPSFEDEPRRAGCNHGFGTLALSLLRELAQSDPGMSRRLSAFGLDKD